MDIFSDSLPCTWRLKYFIRCFQFFALFLRSAMHIVRNFVATGMRHWSLAEQLPITHSPFKPPFSRSMKHGGKIEHLLSGIQIFRCSRWAGSCMAIWTSRNRDVYGSYINDGFVLCKIKIVLRHEINSTPWNDQLRSNFLCPFTHVWNACAFRLDISSVSTNVPRIVILSNGKEVLAS